MKLKVHCVLEMTTQSYKVDNSNTRTKAELIPPQDPPTSFNQLINKP